MLTTDGHLLNGRVHYRQPAKGFRSGIEPVLLAASVPARAGDRVLEAGTGAGAALLCLCARVPEIRAIGVEIDPDMANLATTNAQENGFETLTVITGRIEDVALTGPFDHAIANPPYHLAGGTRSPEPTRERAKRALDGLIVAWIRRLGGVLRHRGTLTLIVPAGLIPTCIIAMSEAGCPGTALLPLWPKPGRPAKLALLRGVRGARSPMRLLSGLTLHEPGGGFTTLAEGVLRDAEALSWD